MQSEDSGVPGLDADEIDLLDKLVKKAKAGRKTASQVAPQHWQRHFIMDNCIKRWTFTYF